MTDGTPNIRGFILLDQEMHIKRARSQATYEDTLDGMLAAAANNWIYIPLGLGPLVDELSHVESFK